jgi:TonB family protein
MPVSLLLMLLMGQATTPEAPATPVPDVEAVAGQAREGTVELECTVQPDGRVSDCIVRSETPRGMGFGAAALNAARRARLSPQNRAGVATGGKVRFRTTFQLQAPPTA